MRQEIDEAIKRVLDSGQYILGDEVRAFERNFAYFCSTKYAIGVANGTDALYLALRALGIGPGDEVITVSHTCSATACAIKLTGADIVYVDIKEDSMLMAANLIEGRITSKTKAIMPVHLYGRMCDMVAIKGVADRFALPIVEDCAQSTGAGPLHGKIGCHSFYPTKNLGGIGDGGCIVTDDFDLWAKVKALRQYGYSDKPFVSNYIGINSRLDEIQAAVLSVKLKYLCTELERRQALAHVYASELENTKVLTLPESKGTFHQYVVKAIHESVRDELVDRFDFQIHYPVPCHLQPAYKTEAYLPKTEQICDKICSLPMRISIPEATELCSKIKTIMGGN